ncbi:unnamed protein product, partial [Mesorhabditis spiculigera]
MIILDERLQATLNGAVKDHQKDAKDFTVPASFHFMIGSFTGEHDIQVAHLVPCPQPPREGPVNHTNDAIKRMDTEFLAEHADRVIRMLPGGVDLVGIVLISEEKKVLPLLKPVLLQVLQGVAKAATADSTFNLFKYITHMALVSIDGAEGKQQGFLADVSHREGSFSANKISFDKLQWTTIISRIGGRVSGHVPLKSNDFTKDLRQMLQHRVQQILDCQLILIDDVVRNSDDLLIKDQKHKKQSYELALMVQSECDIDAASTIESETANNWHDFVFDVEVRAAVPVKSKVKDAVAAVKLHVIRNFSARGALVADLMDVTEEKTVPTTQIIHQMPRPATTFLPSQPAIIFSDFLFEAEGPEDARENFKDTLGLDVNLENVDDGWERSLAIDEMEVVRAKEVVPDHAPLITTSPENPSQRLPYLIVAMSMMMVLVSWILYRTLAS